MNLKKVDIGEFEIKLTRIIRDSLRYLSGLIGARSECLSQKWWIFGIFFV